MMSEKKLLLKAWHIVKEKYVYIILCIFSVMIISLCFQDTINYDEFFSLNWCRLSWRELMKTLINDVHPPLYYWILKAIYDLTNESIFFARLLSAVCCIFFLWYGSLFVEQNFGKIPALFYACFTYLNPFMIQKATEIRMYMMATAFIIVSGIMAYRILKGATRKEWIIFTISSLVVAYIQYFGLLTMCFLYGGLLIYFIFTRDKKNIYAWLKCSLATVVGYLPWLPIAIKQITTVNGVYWITMPSSRLGPLRELFYSKIPYTEHIYMLIMILFVIMSFIIFVKKRSVEAYWMLVCNSAIWGILIFSIIYAIYVRPVLTSRYLIMATCLAFLGMSAVVRYLNKYIVIAICLLCTMVGALRYESIFVTQCNRNTTYLIEFVEKNVTEDDKFVFVDDHYGYLENCLEYYFPGIEAESVETYEIDQISEIAKSTGGVLWFLDVDNSVLAIENMQIEDYGEHGFGLNLFRLYKLSRG